MAKKNMTINDLAVMVQKGFEKTSTKEQVENLESRIENLEFRSKKARLSTRLMSLLRVSF